MKCKIFFPLSPLIVLCFILYTPIATGHTAVNNAYAGIDFYNDHVRLLDAAGTPLIRAGSIYFSWSPQVAVPTNAVKLDATSLRVDYRIDRDDTERVCASAKFKLDGRKIIISHEIFAPEDVKTGGIMYELLPLGKTKKQTIYKSGLWTRNADGGVPYEVRDEYIKEFKGENKSLWLLVRGNHTWHSNWAEHLRVESTDESGWLSAETVFVSTQPDVEDFEAAAISAGRPLALRLSSNRDFNIWESGNPLIRLDISNTSDQELSDLEVKAFAYDYDGNRVLDIEEQFNLEANTRNTLLLQLPSAEREIYFMEASVILDGVETDFIRTNVAILPPHTFEHREDSILGISAFFDEPSREAIFSLMQRIGIRHLRNNDNVEAQQHGMIAFMHNNVDSSRPYDPMEDAEKLQDMVQKYETQQNAGWEFCNEWGFNKSEESREKTSSVYVSWLNAIDAMRKANGRDINLISVGLAGADIGYLNLIASKGGWSILDGVAMHPGRGNMTPDCLGSGWFYQGSIQRMKNAMEELGGSKPLYLTEVYACTQANNWWNDSFRLAAENTLLTLLIAVAEEVASVQFYQMHNSVWYDIKGINHNDREYDFGLLMRDNSPKPSLMAFAAAAEALDGAEFLHYLSVPKTRVRGMVFSTPRGIMTVLYDRTDGHFFSKNIPGFVHKEPWIKHWATEKKHVFKTKQNEVITVDPVGREKSIPAENGEITLTLSGSPLIVYGLDISPDMVSQ